VIAAHVLARAHRASGDLAVITADRVWSWEALVDAAGAVRAALEQCGAGPGDVVALAHRWDRRVMAAALAIADLGAIVMPVDHSWRRREVAWLLGQVPVRALIALPDARTVWREAGLASDAVIDLDSTRRSVPIAGTTWPPAQTAAYLITSGSTGVPRIVPRTHGGIIHAATTTSAAVGFSPGARLVTTTPCHQGSGFSNNLMLPLLAGGTCVVPSRLDPLGIADAIVQHRAEWLCGSPALYGVLIDARLRPPTFASLHACVCGGAAMSSELQRRWSALGAAPLRQFYGSTETGLVSVQAAGESSADDVGRPLPGTEVRILPATDGASDTTGEILVKGPNTFGGYLAGTAAPARFSDGFFHTGDLGAFDATGRLVVAGRRERRFNLGGQKVDPTEVRQVLAALPGVRACRVDAEPGPRGIDIIVATLVTEPRIGLTRADVLGHCREHLAEYKIPRRLIFTPASEHELSGKLPAKWAPAQTE
jgi:acyl-CoA synthetase (AMP-forming)/AMP-acid ligase II